jgi:uncharacterized protein DUF1629
MPEYCLLANSIDGKEIGSEFHQTQGLPDGYTVRFYDRPNSMTKLNNDEFPKDNTELIWQMEPKAILTDVVSASNITAQGLLCNNKVREIFESHKLCEHKFYPATLIHEGKELNYHWFHPIEQDLDIIDFEKSEFALTDYARFAKESIYLNSYSDVSKIREAKPRNRLLSIMKLKLIESIVLNVLLFSNNLHDDIIIDKSLKNELRYRRISGIRFITF